MHFLIYTMCITHTKLVQITFDLKNNHFLSKNNSINYEWIMAYYFPKIWTLIDQTVGYTVVVLCNQCMNCWLYYVQSYYMQCVYTNCSIQGILCTQYPKLICNLCVRSSYYELYNVLNYSLQLQQARVNCCSSFFY